MTSCSETHLYLPSSCHGAWLGPLHVSRRSSLPHLGSPLQSSCPLSRVGTAWVGPACSGDLPHESVGVKHSLVPTIGPEIPCSAVQTSHFPLPGHIPKFWSLGVKVEYFWFPTVNFIVLVNKKIFFLLVFGPNLVVLWGKLLNQCSGGFRWCWEAQMVPGSDPVLLYYCTSPPSQPFSL